MTAPLPTPPRRLAVNLPVEHHYQLRLLALQQNTTATELVREMVEQKLQSDRPAPAPLAPANAASQRLNERRQSR